MMRAGGARDGASGRRGAMRAAAASGKVIVPEGENDGLTSSADSAQFQSDELEVRDLLILFLTFQNCGTYHTASISGGCPFSACDSRAEVDARSVSLRKWCMFDGVATLCTTI